MKLLPIMLGPSGQEPKPPGGDLWRDYFAQGQPAWTTGSEPFDMIYGREY